MSSDRCARCGRDQTTSDYGVEGSAPGTNSVLPGAPYGAWLSVEGHDVCPRCQSADERRDAEERVVAAVEREIERRHSEGIPPDQHEGPLVEHAMEIRAGAGPNVREGDTEPNPQHIHAPADRTDRLRLRVAVTGAFLTGHPLAVHLDDYGDLQRALGRELRGPEWRTEGLHGDGGTYQSGGGFTEAVPLTIARREGVDLLPWLSAALGGSPHDASGVDRPARGLDARPLSLAIDVYDLGVAVMTAWFDVISAPGAGLGETARAVKQLVWLRAGDNGRSPLVAALKQIAHDTADQYANALVAAAPKDIQAAWLSGATRESPAQSAADRAPAEQGRLLWLHPIHVLQSAASAELAAQELAPAFRENIAIDDGVFAAGIGWSAIVVRPESSAAATPVRLTVLHWAYYALYMAIDRGLLGVLNQQRWSQRAPLRQLEADADDVFADYLRVMDARARLDSALSALGGDELGIWETVAKVQRFEAIVDGVERKLNVLQTLAQRRVDLASADRARRIGDILGGLTVLTVVTVTVALIGVFLGSIAPGAGTTLERGAVVGTAVVIALWVYWFAFVRSSRPHRRSAPKA